MNRYNINRSTVMYSAVTIFFVGIVILVSACAESPSVLQQIKKSGELVIITRNNPTTFYEGPSGATGFEYDLAKLFADYLGVHLKIKTPSKFSDILPAVTRREAHIAAAGLTITEARKKYVRFGPSYMEIKQQLVYRSGTKPPKIIDDIKDGRIEVIAESSHAERIRQLSHETNIDWYENPDVDSEELLSLVSEKKLDFTIADSHEISMNQHFYPELRVAFDLSAPQQLAWAFPKGKDDSLYNEANIFFADIKNSGMLDQLIERHYGHLQNFDYVGTRKFLRHVDQRLVKYEQTFKQAARNYDIDWRFLASIGYQESHWNPRAISPTGVRGIMMLTRTTAADMGIRNRIDPANSIRGGARYFHQLKNRLSDDIREPDRTWFALAAYNMGLGHVRDAREITGQLGGDPDKWLDVKKALPLLMQKRFHSQTRHGYARGKEALQYVENIRSYYDILVRLHDSKKPKSTPLTTVSIQPDDFRDMLSPIL